MLVLCVFFFCFFFSPKPKPKSKSIPQNLTQNYFSALDVNYDAASGGALRSLELPTLGFDGDWRCTACYLHVGASLEFVLRLRRSAWGVPRVELLRIAMHGEMALGARLGAALTVQSELALVQPLLEAALGPTLQLPLVGVLALNCAPSAVLELELSGGLNTPAELDVGFAASASASLGAQVSEAAGAEPISSFRSSAKVLGSGLGKEAGKVSFCF